MPARSPLSESARQGLARPGLRMRVPLMSMLSRKVWPVKSGPVSAPSSKTMEILMTVPEAAVIGGEASAPLARSVAVQRLRVQVR